MEFEAERAELPGDTDDEKLDTAVKCSVGRSARVSYNNHDGERDIPDDLRLATTLFSAGHMAPYEHVCRPMNDFERDIFGRTEWAPNPRNASFTGSNASLTWNNMARRTYYLGNFNGWLQARKLIPGEKDILAFERP